jgi:integrase
VGGELGEHVLLVSQLRVGDRSQQFDGVGVRALQAGDAPGNLDAQAHLDRIPAAQKVQVLDRSAELILSEQGLGLTRARKSGPYRKGLGSAPKVPQSNVRPFESWLEVEKVAGHAGRYGPIIKWACATGMRPEEWAGLRWSDLDLRTRTCRVSQVIVEGVIKRTGKTDGALRTVGLPDVALDILTAMPRPLDGRELVFKAPMGGPVSLRNLRSRVWYKALANAGVERRPPYQCRHTFATLALAAGADVYWVSRQLGHTNIATTLKHYARFLPDVQERNLGLLNSYFQTKHVSEVGHGDKAR